MRGLIQAFSRLVAAVAGPERRRENPYRIELEDAGFAVLKRGRLFWRIRWAEIREVVAFKRDRLTTDLVCFAFRDVGENLWHELNEDIPGFAELEERLAAELAGFDDRWREKVILPPFALNRTVIYSDSFGREEDRGGAVRRRQTPPPAPPPGGRGVPG